MIDYRPIEDRAITLEFKSKEIKDEEMPELSEVNKILRNLQNARIVELCVDLKHRRLILGLEIPYSVPQQSVELSFGGVASFFYADGENASRRRRPDWEFVELTEAIFRPGEDVIKLINTSKEPKPSFTTCANFVIDIWSSASLYIEAEDIEINGRKIKIGYPKCPDIN
jgi:hypothetical protein